MCVGLFVFCLFVCWNMCLRFVCWFVCWFVCCLFVGTSVCGFICLFVGLFVVCWNICLRVCLFVCLLEPASYSCSCVWKRRQSSRSCRRHRRGLRCCTGTSCTRPSACRRLPCLTCRCYCCTGTAGSAQKAEMGYHSNLAHTPRIDPLKQIQRHK